MEIFVTFQNIWKPISKIAFTNTIMYSHISYTYPSSLERRRMNGEAIREDEKI
jgi:hypothetical protein